MITKYKYKIETKPKYLWILRVLSKLGIIKIVELTGYSSKTIFKDSYDNKY